jgi:hypothetical protein
VTVLREYKPHECDEQGVPLDWDECRACGGTGIDHTAHRRAMEALAEAHEEDPIANSPATVRRPTCEACGGHGSLKAAALADAHGRQPGTLHGQPPARCEGCGHPMGDGTWERGAEYWHEALRRDLGVGSSRWAFEHLRRGNEPPSRTLQHRVGVHFSPCDEGCRHDGPGRHRLTDEDYLTWKAIPDTAKARTGLGVGNYEVEASWRQVDVRTGVPAPANHPHPMIYTRPWNLRPENLALLCLRCWAGRAQGGDDA